MQIKESSRGHGKRVPVHVGLLARPIPLLRILFFFFFKPYAHSYRSSVQDFF